MKRSASISAVLAALVVGIVLLALQLTSGSDPAGAQPEGGSPAESSQSQTHGRLVRADSHRLQTASDSKVTLVEFLDFECEACRAAYPFVEQLRNDYAGKVTFVLRYFPIASHKNAMNAALAVEAAAQQGKLEPMYQRMYASQAEWGEQQSSQAARFRTDAIVLGLDMAAYDKAVLDPATLARVEKDRQDGLALGVQGTPTFFLNGKQVTAQTEQQFRAEIDAALAGR
ncbi:thioredoxin domain-containing protein [Terrabacter sp. NPDC000476]|uniref:DsbA family protein n=1 Tax=Terrabacter sp. NPDC000476 TaxID=3154258 RepID=UPI00331E726C